MLLELSLALKEVETEFMRRHDYHCTDREGAVAKARRGKIQSDTIRNEKHTATEMYCDIHVKNEDRQDAFSAQSDITTKVREAVRSISQMNHRRWDWNAIP